MGDPARKSLRAQAFSLGKKVARALEPGYKWCEEGAGRNDDDGNDFDATARCRSNCNFGRAVSLLGSTQGRRNRCLDVKYFIARKNDEVGVIAASASTDLDSFCPGFETTLA